MVASSGTGQRTAAARTPKGRGVGTVAEPELRQLLVGLTAVRDGDFGTHLPTDRDGLLGEIATVFNGMVDQLSLFTSEVTWVAREVGTEGRLGGQAAVPGVDGTWKDLTDSVNAMAGNLTTQVRSIARVATAVARGDLTRKIDVDARGEILELKTTINTMVDQLSAFADEVTRVAREVGTEGNLGGLATVRGVSGTWKDLTESVNVMGDNLTAQVWSIAQVTTAVAQGDLTVVCGIYDSQNRVLEWARAGHPPPVLTHESTAAALPLPGGILLGAVTEAEYEERRLSLVPGDRLLMYTDGLIERRDRSVEKSLEQLLATVGAATRELGEHLDVLLTHARSDTDDDTCLIGIDVG